ncbi:MAG: YcaO-like family protein [Geminicoccaceae bacterium]
MAPVKTVARMRKIMPAMGITRIANVTGLDRVGIPVTTVCRPNSRSIAVAQGKGIDLAAAEASGLMEAIETYHAERIDLPLKYASFEELAYTHEIVNVERLPQLKDSLYHPCLPLLWIEGRDLISGAGTWLPFELVHTNYADPMPPGSGCFFASSNGLASGNQLLEAISHGICEVVERDATALWYQRSDHEKGSRRIQLESIRDPNCRALLDKYEKADIAVAVWNVTTDVSLPAFYCWVMERGGQERLLERPTVGAGCHPVREVALSRALTEAAQERLTLITGSRDDLDRDDYHGMSLDDVFEVRPEQDMETTPSFPSDTISADVERQLGQLEAASFEQVFVIDLTKYDLFDIPVARVIIPGLEGLADDPCYVPGARAQAARIEAS